MEQILKNLGKKVSRAVAGYWLTRESQIKKQKTAGRADQGARGAVTGGAQMDGFISLLTEIIKKAGVDDKRNRIGKYHYDASPHPG